MLLTNFDNYYKCDERVRSLYCKQEPVCIIAIMMKKINQIHICVYTAKIQKKKEQGLKYHDSSILLVFMNKIYRYI